MAKRRVLIADDDPVVRLFLRDVFGKIFGFDYDEADTVARAVEKTASGGYDLVLLDQHLSDGTLADYCRLVARGGRGLDTPKWVVSGEKPLDWDEAGMKACGVQGYLVKPCRIEELREIVDKQFPGSGK